MSAGALTSYLFLLYITLTSIISDGSVVSSVSAVFAILHSEGSVESDVPSFSPLFSRVLFETWMSFSLAKNQVRRLQQNLNLTF